MRVFLTIGHTPLSIVIKFGNSVLHRKVERITFNGFLFPSPFQNGGRFLSDICSCGHTISPILVDLHFDSLEISIDRAKQARSLFSLELSVFNLSVCLSHHYGHQTIPIVMKF